MSPACQSNPAPLTGADALLAILTAHIRKHDLCRFIRGKPFAEPPLRNFDTSHCGKRPCCRVQYRPTNIERITLNSMRTAEVSDVKDRSKDSGTRQERIGREYPLLNSYGRAGEPFRCDFAHRRAVQVRLNGVNIESVVAFARCRPWGRQTSQARVEG